MHPSPEARAEVLLSARDLNVQYGALRALDGATFEVRAGEVLGVIGPNGAGKSTCFAALTNCVARAGSVTLRGASIDKVPTQRLAALGLKRTFQQNSFFGEISVLENAVCALFRSSSTAMAASFCMPWVERRQRHDAEDKARALLRSFHVGDEFHQRLPTEIPYGVQRLLSIAMAYGDGAQVLLLDEPAAGIGGEDMRELMAIIAKLRRDGVGVVVIEHHMDLIMELADNIVVLDRGKQIAIGLPAQIRANEQVREAYLGKEA